MDGIAEAVENVDRFNRKLLDSDKALLAIVERAHQLSNEFTKVSGYKEFADAQKRAEKATADANEESRKRVVILSDLERAQAALKKAQADDATEVQRLRMETAELVKQQRNAARESLGLVNTTEAEARTKKQLTSIALAELKIRKETAAALEAEARTKREAAMVLQAETRAKREGITIAQAEERLRKELAAADAAEVRLKKEKVGLTTAEIQQERELANAIAAEAKAKQETIRIAEAETRAKKELANLAAAEAKAARESTNAAKAELQLNERREKQVANSLSAYRQFGKQVADAKRQAKDLGAEMVLLEQSFKRGEISKKTYNKELDRLSKEYVEATVKAKGLDLQIKKIDASVGDSQRNVGNYKSAVAGLATSFRGALAAFGVVGGMTMFANVARDSFDTVKELNAQNNALKQVFETESQVAFQKEYLRDISERYGLELLSTTEAYTKYGAAIKNTSLEGEKGRAIFESFSGAAAKLALPAEETTGIFKALEQMISKGKIQAEELRGQLGDRMSGAFRLFAESMGLSTAQLDELLKKGGVIADDVLPKVSDRLNETYNLKTGERIETLAGAQARLTNEWVAFLDAMSTDKELMGGLADAMEFAGEVMEFLLDTLVVKGEDGVSVLGDLTDIFSSLVGMLYDVADGFGLLDDETKNTLLSLNGFKNDLTYLKALVATFTGYIKLATETVSAFFGTMFQDNGWSKFLDRMDKASSKMSAVYNKLLKVEAGIKKANKEGNVYDDKPSEFDIAWKKALSSKQKYFQYNGKYYENTYKGNKATVKNTNKSLDDYIDRDGQLVKKEKADPTKLGGDHKDAEKARKKAERERKKAERDAERAAEQARKLAYENAKAEIEARKLSLDFLEKAFNVEKKTVSEAEIFYSYYYNQKFALLEKERDLELSVAKTAGERKKIQQKYELDILTSEQEKHAKIKSMRIESADSDLQFLTARYEAIYQLGLQLTDGIVEIEKKKSEELLQAKIRLLQEKYELDDEEVRQKVANNEILTSAEKSFYAQSLDLHKENTDYKKQIDTEYYETVRSKLEQLISLAQRQRNELFNTGRSTNDADDENQRYNNEVSAAQEAYNKSLEFLIKNENDVAKRNKLIEELNENHRKLEEDKLQEHEDILNNIRREGLNTMLDQIASASEKAGHIGDLALAMDQFRAAEQMRTEAEKNGTIAKDREVIQEAYMEGLSTMLGGVKAFAKEGSATWKALSVFQASLNMFVGISAELRQDYSLIKKLINISLITATGLQTLNKIRQTPNPRYAEGTLFAPATTTAITDEEGPELHYDRNWKLKDKGSSGGARFKQVHRGDKILPADLSKLIMTARVTVPPENNRIDYDLLASKIADKTGDRYEKALENQKKEFYFPIDGEIVRIESKGNTRIVYRNSDSKPTGQRLE